MSNLREHKSEILDRLDSETKNDPWHIKIKRWWRIQKWLWTCRTRFIWDLNYSNNFFKKKMDPHKISKNMRDEKSQEEAGVISIENAISCAWSITPHLRYVKVYINGKFESKLQQMWQGSDGSVKWEWVEEIDNTDI